MIDDSHYNELNQLIQEYEEDYRAIRSERVVMKYYPKVFTMCVASLFECNIKKRCDDFIQNHRVDLDNIYPKISQLKNPIADEMYKKFHTKNMNFDASKFYELFNGTVFKDRVIEIFEVIKQEKILNIQEHKTNLYKLLTKDEKKYENDYAITCDLHDRYNHCSFTIAENSFLHLKYLRNGVAHDYTSDLIYTFIEIQNFYYEAVIYVLALEKAIEEWTNI